MRVFFLLLLISNVLFLLWQIQYPVAAPAGGVEPNGRNAPNSLVLLEELSTGQQAPEQQRVAEERKPGVDSVARAAPQEGTENSQAGGAQYCLRVSGLYERQARDELLNRLQRLGVSRIDNGTVEGVRTLHWVLLAPYENREQAVAAADILRRNKVREFFIVRSGEQENAISLGVFSSRERAERRLQQINDLNIGLKRAEITLRESPAEVYWFSIRLSTAQQQRISQVIAEDETLQSEEISCK